MSFNHKFRAGFFRSCLLALASFTCAAQEIVPSHAFSAEELTALPAANWLTNLMADAGHSMRDSQFLV